MLLIHKLTVKCKGKLFHFPSTLPNAWLSPIPNNLHRVIDRQLIKRGAETEHILEQAENTSLHFRHFRYRGPPMSPPFTKRDNNANRWNNKGRESAKNSPLLTHASPNPITLSTHPRHDKGTCPVWQGVSIKYVQDNAFVAGIIKNLFQEIIFNENYARNVR